MSDVQDLADALITADRNSLTATTPAWMPQSAAEAIAVQQAIVGGQPIIAWKIGRNPVFGPVAAPMLRTVIVAGDHADYNLAYTSAVETEIGFKLGTDLAPLANGAAHSVETIMDHVASVHLGVELLEDRLTLELRKANGGLALADSLNNGGYVLGPELPRERVLALIADPVGQGHDLTLTFGGQQVASGPAPHVNGNPLIPLLDFLNDAEARQQRGTADAFWSLKAGDIVTTGCFGPPVKLNGARRIEIDWLTRFVIDHAD